MLSKNELHQEISQLDNDIRELENSNSISKDNSINDLLTNMKKIEGLKIKRGARLLLLDEYDKNEFNEENEIAKVVMDESEHYLIERDDKYSVRPDEKIKSVIDILEVAIDHLGNLELEEYELTEGSRLLRTAKFLIDSIIDDVENESSELLKKMHDDFNNKRINEIKLH